MCDEIAVLMSTYNGEKYLSEQLDSIFCQENVEVYLFIRDDGSTDNTINIIQSRPEYRERIILLKGVNVGSTLSFYEIIRFANKYERTFKYYAFADQDDVWLPNKLFTAIKKLQTYDDNVPNLYYSNLKVVDENLNYKYERFSKKYVTNTKKQIMAEICTLGCTCVFNKNALAHMCILNNDELEYHDNWILWVCSFLGNCFYDENSYILYRQHGNNTSGSVNKGVKYILFQIRRIMKIKEMTPCYEQKAKKMLKYYKEQLSKTDLYSLNLLSNYKNSILLKIRLLFTRTIGSGHIIREIGRKIRILLNKA